MTITSLRPGGFQVFVEAARSGQPTLRVEDPEGKSFHLHSAGDPVQTAEAWAERQRAQYREASVIVLLGLGLGYEARALCARLDRQQKLVVIEADAQVWAAARAPGVLQQLVDDPRVIAHQGEVTPEWQQLLGQVVQAGGGHRLAVLRHPAAARLAPDNYAGHVELLRNLLQAKVINMGTLLRFGRAWITNTLGSLSRWVGAPGVALLVNRFAGMPAILVAAGPSLGRNIHLLLQAKGRFLIVAVGTALRPLLAAGIRPDAVVTIDGDPANHRHFSGLSIDDIPLIAEPFVYPAILEEYQGPLWCVQNDNPVACWLEPIRGPIGRAVGGGSVAHVACDLLVQWGCNPIVLVGQDLAYTGGVSHAEGAVNRTQIDLKATSGQIIMVPDQDGEPVPTSRVLYTYLKWFEFYVQSLPPNRMVINATEGGAHMRGATHLPLGRVLQLHGLTEPQDFGQVFAAARAGHLPPDPSAVLDHLQAGLRDAEDFGRLTRSAKRTAEKLETAILAGFRQSDVAKLVRRLDRIDNELKEMKNVSMLLAHIVYPYAVQLVETSAPRVDEALPTVERDRRIAQRSVFLYKGMEESAQYLRRTIEAAIRDFAGGAAPSRV